MGAEKPSLKTSRLGPLSRGIFSQILKGAAEESIVGRERIRGQANAGRFTKQDVDAIMKRSWKNYDLLPPTDPWEPTVGARVNVALSALTVSTYQALADSGVEREYAISLMQDAVWKVYRKWGRIARFMSMLRARGAEGRLRTSVALFLRFPFNPPSYQRRDITNDSAIEFDILRCPVAAYFAGRSQSDLCLKTWCDQDYALAEMWGGSLTRTETIAGGGDRCHFVFAPVSLPLKRRN